MQLKRERGSRLGARARRTRSSSEICRNVGNILIWGMLTSPVARTRACRPLFPSMHSSAEATRLSAALTDEMHPKQTPGLHASYFVLRRPSPSLACLFFRRTTRRCIEESPASHHVDRLRGRQVHKWKTRAISSGRAVELFNNSAGPECHRGATETGRDRH